MNNIVQKSIATILRGIYCLALLLQAMPATAQSNLLDVPIINGCKVTLNTTFAAPDPYYGETNIGLYYRLDGQNGLGSYSWNVSTAGTTATKELQLADGSYDVVCYERRKNGPIKTGHRSFAVQSGGMCGTTMPATYTGGGGQRIFLNASWNLFAKPSNTTTGVSFVYPTANHHLLSSNPVNTPNFPWLFVTLSVMSWENSDEVRVFFDKANLAYNGAIVDNYPETQSSLWQFIESVSYVSGQNFVTVKRRAGTTNPPNRETDIYLIFRNKETNALGSKDTVNFTAIHQDPILGQQTATASPQVKGGPHDPNSLVVDKKNLCPCQAGEWLTYKVDFLNVGNRPATKVTVELKNYIKLLDPYSVVVSLNQNYLKKTFRQQAPVEYDPGKLLFTIHPISLPGTEEAVAPPYQNWQASDYFKFSIRKTDCLKLGTLIRPKVKITFFDGETPMDPIETNLEKTEITFAITEGPCPQNPNPKCPKCKMKKQGLLARWFN